MMQKTTTVASRMVVVVAFIFINWQRQIYCPIECRRCGNEILWFIVYFGGGSWCCCCSLLFFSCRLLTAECTSTKILQYWLDTTAEHFRELFSVSILFTFLVVVILFYNSVFFCVFHSHATYFVNMNVLFIEFFRDQMIILLFMLRSKYVCMWQQSREEWQKKNTRKR